MADETITADTMDIDDLIAFNGIDATTGDYLISPMKEGDASRIAIDHPQDKNLVNAISIAKRGAEAEHLGGAFDIELEDLTQAGWAIVFHQDEDQAVKDAFAPLIDHRREQIGDDNIV